MIGSPELENRKPLLFHPIPSNSSSRTMSAPKGMRSVSFPTNGTDAVHIYSDAQSIWLQLRRDVPTEKAIAKPSFKVALSLTPEQAIAIARELLTAATRKASPQAPKGEKQPKKTKSAIPTSK